jgi:hypothetical protein
MRNATVRDESAFIRKRLSHSCLPVVPAVMPLLWIRVRGIRIAGIVFAAFSLAVASYWWNRLTVHELAHDLPATAIGGTLPPLPVAGTSDGTRGSQRYRHGSVIQGSKGDDVLNGTDAGEKVEALAGRDLIQARGGDDELDGGVDDDVLMGGAGDDVYVIQHHGGGADILVEESGMDTLRLQGGRIALSGIEVLRHGDDLLLQWAHDHPTDAVLIRSWFKDPSFHVERLQLPDGTVVALEPLAAGAREASSEDVIHFTSPPALLNPGLSR